MVSCIVIHTTIQCGADVDIPVGVPAYACVVSLYKHRHTGTLLRKPMWAG